MNASRNLIVVALPGSAPVLHAVLQDAQAVPGNVVANAALCAGTSRIGFAGMGNDRERGRASTRGGAT